MNLRMPFLTILAALAVQTAAAPPLPDCPQVGVMSTALKNISDRDWEQVSTTELLTMWPKELGAVDCDADSCKVR
jgi:hypothetical protein